MKNFRNAAIVVSIAAIFLIVMVVVVHAHGMLLWTATGVPISVATGDQRNPLPVSDGEGGAIVSWLDGRSGSLNKIYVQRISASGQIAWATNGVFAGTSPVSFSKFDGVDDGQQGAFIVWEDYRQGEGWDIGDLFAQHVTANGTLLWATTGLTVCANSNDQELADLISDGAEGAIVAWNEYVGPNAEASVYVQRFNANGEMQWPSCGIQVSAATGYQVPNAALASDLHHGAYVAYLNPMWQVAMQRVLPNGSLAWGAGGANLTSLSVSRLNMVADGFGGAIVAWVNDDPYARGIATIAIQRVLSTSVPVWSIPGISLTNDPSAYSPPQLLADGEGGVYAAWHIFGSMPPHIYAQHVLSTGILAWPTNGITIALGSGQFPNLVADGRGGIIVEWRNYPEYGTGQHSCWMQQIDADGNIQWSTRIITASTSYNSGTTCSMVSDMSHGAIVTWRDWRNGVEANIYAQRVIDFTAAAWVYLPVLRK